MTPRCGQFGVVMALTMSDFTLNVAVGGIARKPTVHEGEMAISEVLDLTISFDHDVVDGRRRVDSSGASELVWRLPAVSGISRSHRPDDSVGQGEIVRL